MLEKLKQAPFPIPCPHNYTLDLYCKWVNEAHAWGEFPHGLVGRDRTDTFKQARDAGWVIHKDCTATCPKCRLLSKESS